jgi:hypothetical protein
VNGELSALVRHFVDLRDGTHAGSVSRADKETHFVREAELLAPFARQALTEIDETLLLRTGTLAESGVTRAADGGLDATWSLSWPEQRAAGISPIAIYAYYGAGFHHPHLRGATVRDWPLNVGSEGDAADQLPILRAIVAADLHNLVFQADFRIVPAVTSHPKQPGPAE